MIMRARKWLYLLFFELAPLPSAALPSFFNISIGLLNRFTRSCFGAEGSLFFPDTSGDCGSFVNCGLSLIMVIIKQSTNLHNIHMSIFTLFLGKVL